MEKTAKTAEFCFQAIEIQKKEGVVEYFDCLCNLCGSIIKPFRTGNEKTPYIWQEHYLVDHLRSCHRVKGVLIEGVVNSISSAPTYKQKDMNSQKLLTNYFKLKEIKDKLPNHEDIQTNLEVQKEPMDDWKPIPIPVGPYKINSSDVMRTMRIVTSNFALTWDKRSRTNDLYWGKELATYYLSKISIPRIYQNMKFYIKTLLEHVRDYSFSCDGWSVLNVNFKAMCFYVHFYYKKQFKSLLLDVVPMDCSSAENLKNCYENICKEYQLDSGRIIVTDNASNNKSAFGTKRIGCFAHRINTACTHLTSKSKKMTGGLTQAERLTISKFFSIAEHICQVFRRSLWKPFRSWFGKNKDNYPDLKGCRIRRPLKPCPTRWIGRLVYLEWLQECGVAAFRYLLCVGGNGIDLFDFHNCLIQVPGVLSLLNIMNNALELLAVENQCSAHLVVPLLYYLKQLFPSTSGDKKVEEEEEEEEVGEGEKEENENDCR